MPVFHDVGREALGAATPGSFVFGTHALLGHDSDLEAAPSSAPGWPDYVPVPIPIPFPPFPVPLPVPVPVPVPDWLNPDFWACTRRADNVDWAQCDRECRRESDGQECAVDCWWVWNDAQERCERKKTCESCNVVVEPPSVEPQAP
jgi:hypothetical protein